MVTHLQECRFAVAKMDSCVHRINQSLYRAKQTLDASGVDPPGAPERALEVKLPFETGDALRAMIKKDEGMVLRFAELDSLYVLVWLRCETYLDLAQRLVRDTLHPDAAAEFSWNGDK